MTSRRSFTPAGRVAESGTTLVELLVAIVLLGAGMAVVATLAAFVLGAFEAEPAAADLQQRMRGAVHVLLEDLGRAGSGFIASTDDAPGQALPAVLPDAQPAAAWAVAARPATVTTWRARRAASQATLAVAAPAGASVVRLTRPAFCAATSPTCGFQTGDDVMLHEPHGRFATAEVIAAAPPLDLQLAAPLAEAWPPGTTVVAVTNHGYELRSDTATGLFQLVRRVGAGPAQPAVDFVTRFDVEWWIDGGVPSVRVAADGTEEHATAGPAPPAPGVTIDPAWAPGENCAFMRDATGVPRWRGSGGGAAPMPVSTPTLADGPWCPAPGAPSRWDVDLARITQVRIVVGVAAAASRLRLSTRLGLGSVTAARPIADLVVETTVRPGRRNGGT
jgi:hypothetical protein